MDDSETLRHELALDLARRLRPLSKERQHEAMVAWLRTAEVQRTAIVKARRVIAERRYTFRSRRGAESDLQWAMRLHELLLAVAINVVTQGVEKTNVEDLSPDEAKHVVSAVDDAYKAMVEIAEKLGGLDRSTMQEVGEAVAATSARGNLLGRLLPTSIAFAAASGSGKTNAPRHIFALALAELGHTTADIVRAGVDGLRDPAHVRRLTRSARVS